MWKYETQWAHKKLNYDPEAGRPNQIVVLANIIIRHLF